MSLHEKSTLQESDQSMAWHSAEILNLNEPARTLLEVYSKIPPDQVVSHVIAIVSLGSSTTC